MIPVMGIFVILKVTVVTVNGASTVAITGCFQIVAGKDRKFYLNLFDKETQNGVLLDIFTESSSEFIHTSSFMTNTVQLTEGTLASVGPSGFL